MKKKLIMTVAATSIALTIGTMTSFAGEAAIIPPGETLSFYTGVTDSGFTTESLEKNEMNDIWDTMTEKEKDNVYNCLVALTASPSS